VFGSSGQYRWLFALVAATLFYFYPGGDPNQTSRYLMTEAIVLRHTPEITPNHSRTVDKGELDGRYYSDKAIGISLLAVPLYAAFRAAERATGLDPNDHVVARARVHMLSFLLAGLPTVVMAALLARVLRRLGTKPSRAALLASAFALGTLVFPYGTVLYGHTLAACLLFAAFVVVFEWDLARTGRDDTPLDPKRALLLGALSATGFIVEYPTALPFAIVVGYALWRSPRASIAPTIGKLAIGVAPLAVVHMAYSTWAFGSPFALPYKYVIEPIFRAHTSSGIFGIGLPIPSAVYGALFSAYRGIFFFCPITVLVFAGYAAWLARGTHLRFAALCAGITIAGFAFVVSYYAWHGGMGVGSRHLVPFCAFLVMPIGYLVERSAGWRVATSVLGATSVLILGTIVAITMHFPEEDPFLGNPLYALVVPALLRGEIGIHFGDVLDSAGRRDAGFNVGTLFGASPALSLAIPLLAWAIAFGYVVLSERRSRAEATA
jgi:hypothetical protein